MNLLARAKLSAHLILPPASLPKRPIYLHPLTSAAIQHCHFYVTKATCSNQKIQSTKPKTQKNSESFAQRVKKPSETLTTVWPKPREIPYQAKVANFVNFIGFVKMPVQFEADADGKNLATTVISQEGERKSLLMPVVFEGDLAHIVACHVKENDCVFVSGHLSIDPMRLVLSESLGKFHVVAENLNFVEVFKRSISDKRIEVLPDMSVAKKVEEVKEVINDDEFNQQWKDALENAKAKKASSILFEESVDLKADADVASWLPAQGIRNGADSEKSGKESAASKKKDGDVILDLWRDLVKNPLQWWDYREHKANGLVKPKYPDFKQKITGESLWINTSPDWVLHGLAKLEFDVKPMQALGGEGAGERKMGGQKGEDSWKDLVENPSKWWDNRASKRNPKYPDFKHKETGEALWVSDLPKWASSELPPTKDGQNTADWKNYAQKV